MWVENNQKHHKLREMLKQISAWCGQNVEEWTGVNTVGETVPKISSICAS